MESAMLARNIARETYLRIEHLQSPQCYVRMSSLMPIDFSVPMTIRRMNHHAEMRTLSRSC
ncbi:hypothetical protein JCM19237_6312 [Photobacterium aphoticum]|uniref:Uncharacterized protein n=1 Tax=Photobacterium aphoticum TaxID=754436 RepID=A0A090QMF8_9GAMM|nr:hypothetical protein JCM19237_6312 [Photobacterium aphoticum]